MITYICVGCKATLQQDTARLEVKLSQLDEGSTWHVVRCPKCGKENRIKVPGDSDGKRFKK